MDVIQKETLVSLSNSVKLLLENIASAQLVDNVRKTNLDVSLLKKVKEILVDLQDLLYYGKHKLIPIQANNRSLHLLTRAVFQVAFLLDQSDFLRYDHTVLSDEQNKISSRLFFYIAMIESETKNLNEILHGSSSGEQLGDNESSIYGRDADIQKLIHLLMSSDSTIRVISIVGMGGIGKTALAKHLYNHPQVNDKFEFKLWADFSNDVDALSVFENILEYVTSRTTTNDTTGMNPIYPNFLLVLDGVWDARSVNWTLLTDIFDAGETGSKVIITTRDERVALFMQTFLSLHYLRPLKVEDCWSLIAERAFGADNFNQQSKLEKIEIAKKCDGLPLAAVVFGTLFFISLDPYVWNHVLESKVQDIFYEVQASLELSYSFLSDPLKRCFQYCSIFPKKSILEKKMVVQLWIAAGLLESSSTNQQKVGEEYFDELVSRSLIHRHSISDEERNFGMHNFIHDLATEVSSPYCINMDIHNLDDRVHTLSYNREAYDSYDKFYKLYGLKGLRTFLALPLQEQMPLCLANKQDCKRFAKLPEDMGKLVNLYYLDVSKTALRDIPKDIGKLVNLHYLDVSETALREMPIQIAKLQNLQTLSDFVVGKHNDGLKVATLGNFPNLHGKLSISQLQNVNDPIEAFRAKMKMKERIEKLALEWDCGTTFSDPQNQSIVLEHLQPSTNLKSLTIKGYGGVNIPNWLGDSLYDNMVYLRISNCDNCIWLPPLGQLRNLKELNIDSMLSVKSLGIEFYGSDSSSFQPFPSLVTLHFEDMPEWEEWNVIGGSTMSFPNLKRLLLSNCPKLQGDIPHKLPSLIELELRSCSLLVSSRRSHDNNNIITIIPMSDVFNRLMLPLNSLQQLTIEDFPSLTSFPTEGLPKTLKFLIINNCENLEFPPHEYLHNYSSLEKLEISYSCNSMISFTLGAFPVLKSLFIEGCINLKSILVAEDVSLKSLSFLRSIKIWDCNELESFPSGLATPNLIYFAVWKCEKLPSLPKAMHTLTHLREMEIDNLPNLQLFVIDDLPSSLQELTVGSIGGIMQNTGPTWKYLTCLSVLRINSDDSVNMLMGPFLPTSLLTLCIYDLNDAVIDGKWFQHLNSLQKLEIVNAPKLKSLPKEGFPSSLHVLSITCCPLLEASLRRKRGKEWRKIALIPFIIINDKMIT